VPQGVGGAEADGGPSIEGFAPPHPPRPSAMAVVDGGGGRPWAVRFDCDRPMGRERHQLRPYMGRPPYKWRMLPTFLLTSVGELGGVSGSA
jgi:hypothetical protein